MAATAIREDPVTRESVRDPYDRDHAARLYLQAKRDAADHKIPPGARQEARRAQLALAGEHPGISEHAAHASMSDLGIDTDPDLKAARDQHRIDVGVSAKDAAQRRRRAQPTAPAGRARGSRHARTDARAAGASRRARSHASRATGALTGAITGPVGGYGALGLQVFGWGVGLSLAYLLLTNSERARRGQSAVELVARGLSNTVATLVSPVADPLSPGRIATLPPDFGTARARRPAGASAVRPSTRVAPGTNARGTHFGGAPTS